MEQDAKDALLEISESQAIHDMWSHQKHTGQSKHRKGSNSRTHTLEKTKTKKSKRI
jgi:hypothetical protein